MVGGMEGKRGNGLWDEGIEGGTERMESRI